MAIFFNFSPTSSHFHPLQVKNCDSNSRLVVDEDDNGEFRLEWVKTAQCKFSHGWLRMIIYIFFITKEYTMVLVELATDF